MHHRDIGCAGHTQNPLDGSTLRIQIDKMRKALHVVTSVANKRCRLGLDHLWEKSTQRDISLSQTCDTRVDTNGMSAPTNGGGGTCREGDTKEVCGQMGGVAERYWSIFHRALYGSVVKVRRNLR